MQSFQNLWKATVCAKAASYMIAVLLHVLCALQAPKHLNLFWSCPDDEGSGADSLLFIDACCTDDEEPNVEALEAAVR
jgi:hypothetical protein